MEFSQGRVVSVAVRNAGDELAVDHALGVTVLQVTDAYPFSEIGGQLTVGGDTLEYTGFDDDTSTIALTEATTAAYNAGTRVEPLSPAPQKVASVVEGNTGDAIPATVPHYLSPMLPEGIREPDAQESVSLLVDGPNAWIFDVIGRPTKIDAGTLVGPVPDASKTDGFPPATAPVVTAFPFAVGAIALDWEPVPNNDPVTYDVYASLTSPVDTTGTPTGSTTGTSFKISSLDGTPIPMDATTPVYAVVVPRDGDGTGPASVEVSAIAKQADIDYISATLAEFLQVNAWEINSAEVNADIVWVSGSFTIGDPNTSHISGVPGQALTLYGADGTTSVIELRMDGQPSVFRGQVIADDVSVMNGLILQGLASTIATNARMTLEDSIPDPSTAPSGSFGTLAKPFVTVPVGAQERGLWWDEVDSTYYQLLWYPGPSGAYVRTVDPVTGAGGPGLRLVPPLATDFTESLGPMGLVHTHGKFYTSIVGQPPNANRSKSFHQFDDATGIEPLTGGAQYPAGNTHFGYATVGWDWVDSKLLWALPGQEVVILDPEDLTKSSVTNEYGPADYYVYPLPDMPEDRYTFVGRGPFDIESDVVDLPYIIIGTPSKFLQYYALAGSGWHRDSGWDTDGYAYAHAWDGSNFFTSHNNGTLKQYAPYFFFDTYLGQLPKVWAGYTDAVIDPSEMETALTSSLWSGLLVRRRYLFLTAPPGSSQTTHTGFYVALRNPSLPPDRTDMWRQGDLIASRSLTIGIPETSGTNPPEFSDFVTASGDPGEIVSQSGGFVVRGDGTGSWPLLDQNESKYVRATTAFIDVTTGTQVDITGMSITIDCPGPDAVYKVAAGFDAEQRSTTAVLVGRLLVDSDIQDEQIILGNPTTSARGTASQRWRITGLSAGSHTFKMTGALSAPVGGSRWRIYSPHSTMMLERKA